MEEAPDFLESHLVEDVKDEDPEFEIVQDFA